MQNILLIDDDEHLVTNVRTYLKDFGYRVEAALDGESGLARMDSFEPDLIVLDLMMPRVDGLEVCRRIRQSSTVPIIILTARGDESDVVVGLEVGADDYLTKPFSLRELAARIKAQLRRFSQQADNGNRQKTMLVAGDLTIDASRMEVYKKSKDAPGQQRLISLTGTEFNLLWMMASQPGVVFSRDRLLEELRNRELEAFDRSIDAHISHLRKKIEDSAKKPRYIITVWGTGYKFQDK